MTAVTLAGQCKERSPVDISIFGAGADAFVARFVDPAEGQGLLAQAVASGAAEARALLQTAAGTRAFRISIWRQRGGDRIRLIAAFATDAVRMDAKGPSPSIDTLERFAHEMLVPLDAIVALARTIRSATHQIDPDALRLDASDIEIAAWRVSRLLEDLKATWGKDTGARAHRVREVNLRRFLRRSVRFAAARRPPSGVHIRAADIAEDMRDLVALVDEDMLWGVVDDLFAMAIAEMDGHGSVAPRLRAAEDGGALIEIASVAADAALEVKAHGPHALHHASAVPPDMTARFEETQKLGTAAGARVSLDRGAGHHPFWTVHVPAARIVGRE